MTKLSPPFARMPYYFSPTNSSYIYSDIHSSLNELSLQEFDMDKVISDLKSKISTNLSNKISSDNFFSIEESQEESQSSKNIAEALKKIKLLRADHFISDPNIAAPLVHDIEQKFQELQEKEKKKIHTLSNLSSEEINNLWLVYEKVLSSHYEPIKKILKRMNPVDMLKKSCLNWIEKMGKKDQPYSELQSNPKDYEFIPRPQFIDSRGNGLLAQYDSTEKLTSLQGSTPFSKNIDDMLAIFIASLKKGEKIPPIKLVLPCPNSDIAATEMYSSIIVLLVIFLDTLYKKYILTPKQKKSVMEAIIKTGIPLKHISVQNSHNEPIVFTPTEQASMEKSYREFIKNFKESIENNIEETNSNTNLKSIQPTT